MTSMQVARGELIELDFRGGREVRVTDHMFAALKLLRPVLIDVTHQADTITYGEAARITNDAYLPRGMGRLLDVLSIDCFRRDEPSLASLVVRKADGEVGDSFAGDPVAERDACYAHWPESATTRHS